MLCAAHDPLFPHRTILLCAPSSYVDDAGVYQFILVNFRFHQPLCAQLHKLSHTHTRIVCLRCPGNANCIQYTHILPPRRVCTLYTIYKRRMLPTVYNRHSLSHTLKHYCMHATVALIYKALPMCALALIYLNSVRL